MTKTMLIGAGVAALLTGCGLAWAGSASERATAPTQGPQVGSGSGGLYSHARARGLVEGDRGDRGDSGVELSFKGKITPRLSIMLRAVLLDTKPPGDAVHLGLTGRRPLIERSPTGWLRWNMPWGPGISFDLAACNRTTDLVEKTVRRLSTPG